LRHDLTVSAVLRDNCGVFPLESLASGRPVAVFDAPPQNKLGASGIVYIECGRRYNGNVPQAIPDLETTWESLFEATSPERLQAIADCGDRQWLKSQIKRSRQVWRGLWGV
ncbi:MAG: hypothetical protein KDA71_19225, partial [Planctomycetales bacterium]|nr:hypothetical protein [Planctomycetales bacterium]